MGPQGSHGHATSHLTHASRPPTPPHRPTRPGSPSWTCRCDGTCGPPPPGRGRVPETGPGPGEGKGQSLIDPAALTLRRHPVGPARLTPDRVRGGFFRSGALLGVRGFLQNRDFGAPCTPWDLCGRGSRVLALFPGGPGAAPAAAGVVSSSQYRRGFWGQRRRRPGTRSPGRSPSPEGGGASHRSRYLPPGLGAVLLGWDTPTRLGGCLHLADPATTHVRNSPQQSHGPRKKKKKLPGTLRPSSNHRRTGA